MLLTPKRWKFRKPIIRSLTWKSTSGNSVVFGDFGIKAVTSGYLTNKQIEASRKVIVRVTRKFGKVWLRVFPDVPFTKKWLEMPMGTWKWDVDIYTAPVKKWKIIFEIWWIPRDQAYDILTRCAKKLPIKTRVVAKWEIR